MALWTDIDPAELTAFTRIAFEAVDTGPYADILPNLFQENVFFTWRVNEVLSEVAEYGEFDTEAPIGREGKGEEKGMRLLPVARKLRLSEYEQVTDLDRVQVKAEDKADQLVRDISNRLHLARAEALVSGSIVLNENGLKQNIDFGRSASHTNAAPTALWDGTGASRDPISDLKRWRQSIIDKTGTVPNYLGGSDRAAGALASALVAAGYINGGGGPVVPRALVNDVLVTHGLPTYTVDDSRVAGRRLAPDTHILLASTGGVAGRTVHAPTVESRDPRFNLAGQEPGIIAGVYSDDDPPVRWVLAKTVGVPCLANPDTTLSAKVLGNG